MTALFLADDGQGDTTLHAINAKAEQAHNLARRLQVTGPRHAS
jgi:hypothetical protein